MAFVDKIEKMEQKFWPIAFKKTKEATRKTLSPKNYKWGLLGMVAYGLGCIVSRVLSLGGMVIDSYISDADSVLFDPSFSDVEGNIYYWDYHH